MDESSSSDSRKIIMEKKQVLPEMNTTSTDVEKMNVTMRKVADHTNKTASKASFTEIWMMHCSQGYSASACMRHIRNAFDKWSGDRSDTYLVGIVRDEYIKYANNTGGRIQPNDEIWKCAWIQQRINRRYLYIFVHIYIYIYVYIYVCIYMYVRLSISFKSTAQVPHGGVLRLREEGSGE